MSAKYIFVTGESFFAEGSLPAASIGCSSKPRPEGQPHEVLTPTSTSTPGTMSPFQHGEVFVTDDGAETDLAWPL